MYTYLLWREVLCALTHLLCRGWARLHLHECTLVILSRRVSPVQMHLGYSNPHQDLLWLLCMHFSLQQMMMMPSCPWSSMLRMCQQLEWNQTRMLTWGRTMQACSAPVVCPAALARCDWVGHGMRWRCLLCARHRLTPGFLPPLN